jgi:fibronectin-binding autotransporter adhesin
LLTVNNLVLTSNTTINGDGSGTLSVLTGTGTLTYAGTGILNLNGGATNTYALPINLNTGTIRLGADSVITAGAVSGGPLGTAQLNMAAGTTLQENNTARTIGNSLVINGNATFSTSGTAHTVAIPGAGRLTFDDTGLTTPSTISINAATNPTLTVNTLLTFNESLSVSGGADGFTKAGTGKLVIGRNYTGKVNVTAGTLSLHPTLGLPGANVTVSSGGYLQLQAAGSLSSDAVIGSGGSLLLNPVSQAILDSADVTSTGVAALGVDSSTNLDFSAFTSGFRLGAAPLAAVYSGTITPAGSTYRLGGGGGTLIMNGPLTGAGNSLDVGLGGTTISEVVLNNSANSFDGGTTIGAMPLVVRNEGSLGAATSGVTFGTAGGTLSFLNAMSLGAGRAVSTGTVGGTLQNNGFNVTLAGPISGTGALTLSGSGTNTITGSISATPLVIAAPTTTALGTNPLGTGTITLQNNLTLNGAGNLALPGNFTYIGGTLGFGTSTIGQTLTIGGTFTKGARGALVLAPTLGTTVLGTASGEKILVGGTAPTVTNGMVSGVFGRDTTANNGTFLTYDTTNGFVPVTYTAGEGTGATVIGEITTAVVRTSNGSNQALRIANGASLAINPSASASFALTIGTGGLILNGNAAINQTSNGNFRGQIAFGGNDGLIYAGGDATINAQITGTGGINITGPGSVSMTAGLNLFTGNLNVTGGTLAFAAYTDTTTTTTATAQGAGGNRITVLDAGGTLRLTSGTFNPVGGGRFLNIGAGGGVLDLRGSTYQADDANQLASVTGTAGPLTVTNAGGTGAGTLLIASQNYAVNGPILVNATTGGTSTLRMTSGSLTSTLGNGLASAIHLGANGIFDLQTSTSRSVVLNGGSLAPSTGTGTQNGVTYSIGGGTIGGAGTTVINGEIVLDTTGATLGGAGAMTVNGVISGSGVSGGFGITKTGAGTATVLGTNTYTGGTTIQAGIIDLRNPQGAGGTSTNYTNITIDGGALNVRYDVNNTTYFNNLIVKSVGTSNAANMRIGNITASATNPLTANFGTITFDGTSALGMDEVGMSTGGSYQLTTTGVILNGNGTFDLGAGSGATNFGRLLINGPITETGGSRSLTFNQAKTADTQFRATLTGAGSYTGGTTIGFATVFAQNATAFGTTNSTITINNASGILETQLDANSTFAQNVSVTTAATMRVGRQTAGAGVTSTFGNLSLSANTFTTAVGSNVTTNTAYGLNFAATALNGNATVVIANNGTGTGTLGLGTLSGTGNLLKNATGTVTNAGGTMIGNLTVDNGAFISTGALAVTGNLTLGNATSTTTPVALTFNENASFSGTVLHQINSATASTMTIAPTKTLTLNGNLLIGANPPAALNTVNSLTMNGGGSLNMTTAAGGLLQVGGNNTNVVNISENSILNLTSLASATINVSSTGTVRVNQPSIQNSNVAGNQSSLLLPTPSVSLNSPVTTITAGTFSVGDGSSNGEGPGQINTVTLGTGLTTLNTNTVNVGTGGRDFGQINFASGNGTLILRGADGLNTSRVTFNIGTGNTTTGVGPGTGVTNNVDLTGHNVDLLLSTLTIGAQARNTSRSDNFSFNQGTLDVTTVVVGSQNGTANTGAASSTWTSTLNIGGGSTDIGSGGLDVGVGSTAVTGTDTLNGVVNISGGINTIANNTTNLAAVRLGRNTVATGLTTNGTLNITGGTTTVSGDIIDGAGGGGTGNSILTLNGGTLDMNFNRIGGSAAANNLTTLNFITGTLSNVAQINNGGALNKSTAGILVLAGANTYTGATSVSAGTLRVNGSITSAVTVTAGTLDGTGDGLTTGLIAGPVVIGNSTGSADAILAPGNSIGSLTATGSLTFNSDALFAVELNSNTSQTDLMAANGVTIDPAASISFTDLGSSAFAPGVYTLINNTSNAAISGVFSNLADNSTFMVGANSFTASYTGGTGNDLVLTVAGVIPEPSTLVVGGLTLLGFAGVGLRRRRLAQQQA